MTKENHIYKKVLADSPSGRPQKAKRGGCPALRAAAEINHYNNEWLLSQTIIRKHVSQSKIKNIMAKQNVLETALGKSVLSGVRSSLFNAFTSSLVDALVSSSSAGRVGRLSYAAAVGAWIRDTDKCAFRLNETEGKKLYNADKNDPRVRRIGVEGHYSFFVCPKADEMVDSDSLSVLLRGWLSSWLSWYESVIQYGHYTTSVDGVYSTGSALDGVLGRFSSLWSYRGRGGRVASSDAEKAERKAAKAVDALDADAALLLLARKLGLSVSALRALQAGSGSDDDSAADDNKENASKEDDDEKKDNK